MISNGISEAASKNTFMELLKDGKESTLLGVIEQGVPEAAAAAIAILREREAASKKGRGRPKVLDKATAQITKGCAPDVRTTRGLQNVHYRQIALVRLGCGDDERFKWLCDRDAMAKGAPNAWQPGILAELGRFDDDDEMLACAEAICEAKPKTKDAIARLRRARLDKSPASDTLTLANRIIGLINQYSVAHPDLTKDQMLDALATARGCVESSGAE